MTHTAYKDMSQWTMGELDAKLSPMKYAIVPTADIANTEEPGGNAPGISVQVQATNQ